LGLRHLAIGDVTHKRAECDGAAGAERCDGKFDRELMSVTMKRGQLDALVKNLGLSGRKVTREALSMRLAKTFRHHELVNQTSQRFLTGPAEYRFRLGIPRRYGAGLVDAD